MSEHPVVPQQATLPALQKYVKEVCEHRGWDSATDLETFLLFTEEVGELAKAIRKERQLFAEKVRPNSSEVGEELADLLSYLLDLSNRLGVDLEQAFRAKEAVNAQRVWS